MYLSGLGFALSVLLSQHFHKLEEYGGLNHLSMLKSGYVAVPMTPCLGESLYCVPCRIKDESFNMLVDTGAQSSHIDYNIAKRLGLKLGLERKEQSFGVINSGHDVSVKKLILGDFDTGDMGGNVRLIACDLTSLNQKLKSSGGTPIGGILGHGGLAIGSAVIDYPSNILYLRTPMAGFWPQIKGRWIGIHQQQDGENVTINPKLPPLITFKDRKLTLFSGGSSRVFGMQVAPIKNNMAVFLYDISQPESQEKEYLSVGIIKVFNDRLMLCLGIDPSQKTVEFTTCPGDGKVFFECVREKP